MPAPGDQHSGRAITNPFEDVKARISEYTASEIATLQSRLEKQLGPEYISSRAGPSGQKIHYLAAEKCIQLANEVFGFNGWSSQIMDVQVDYVDEVNGKVSLGLSVIVRVTLRDGTFHEDIGYGHFENSKGKAAAFEKAKKEGTTDGLKRALRNFGNVLGNCIYDKDYLKQVTKIKPQPTKWNVDKLHRHSDYAPTARAPEAKPIEERSQNEAGPASISTEDTIDDEFGDFDDADFNVADPTSHPDEVVLHEPAQASHHSRNGNTAPDIQSQNRLQTNRSNPAQGRPINGGHHPGNVGGNVAPQTPIGGFSRSNSGAGQGMRPPPAQPALSAQPPNPVARRVLNQPSRNGPPSAPASPARPNNSSADDNVAGQIPPGPLPRFVTGKAVPRLPEGATIEEAPSLPNLPSFNPNAESPSIRKTPGIDHKSSKPIGRDLKHVPGSTQPTSTATVTRPSNIVNPQLDGARRIGVPGSPSPMANRGQFKQPVKRSTGAANRTPLADMPANEGGDTKRQRLSTDAEL